MRQIKFRGKRYNHKEEWVHGYYCQIESKHFIIPEDAAITKHRGFIEGHYEVIPETVGQFTDKHDRENREIYEGHVVIKYFENPKGTSQERRIVVKIPDFYEDWFGLEGEYLIIGDIHENPELLEQYRREFGLKAEVL